MRTYTLHDQKGLVRKSGGFEFYVILQAHTEVNLLI